MTVKAGLLLLLLMWFACGCTAPAPVEQAPPASGEHPFLFEPMPEPAERFAVQGGRRRSIQRGLRLRHELLDLDAAMLPLTLNPFADVALAFHLQPLPEPSPGTKAWFGVRDDGAETTMVFRLATADRPAGFRAHLVSPGHGIVTVDPASGFAYVATRLDPRRTGTCVAGAGKFREGERGSVPAEAQDWFDVLVLFTNAGGDIDTLIDLAVAQANQALASAGVTTQVRVVHRAAVEYDEVGTFGEMLQDLTDGKNGLAVAKTLRNTHAADLVCLLVERGDAGGEANVMKTPSPGFENRAFSVVSRQWAAANYSFIHELGHNMGCCHQLTASFLCWPYAHGWPFVAQGHDWMTIMARGAATRILRFSDPGGTLLGTPIGVAGQADNARVLRENAGIVAGFR